MVKQKQQIYLENPGTQFYQLTQDGSTVMMDFGKRGSITKHPHHIEKEFESAKEAADFWEKKTAALRKKDYKTLEERSKLIGRKRKNTGSGKRAKKKAKGSSTSSEPAEPTYGQGESVYLEQDEMGRFWETEIHGEMQVVHHGLVGYPGTKYVKEHGDDEECVKQTNNQIKKKVAAGYVVVEKPKEEELEPMATT